MDFTRLGQGELEAHHLPRRESAEVKHELVLEHALSLSLVLGVDVNLRLNDGHQTGGEHLTRRTAVYCSILDHGRAL